MRRSPPLRASAPMSAVALARVSRPGRRRRVLVVAACFLASGCSAPSPWFVERTAELGVDLRYHSGDQERKWLPTIMGGGIALFDADGDDDLDLYVVDGNDHLLDDRADGPITNHFLRNEGGRFRDDTAASGLGDARYGQGVAIGDVDNDGDLDVYVTNFGADQLYRNGGDGRFTNVTREASIDVDGHSASAAFCDVDRDGWLDLFVARYIAFDPDTACFDPAGRRDFCGPHSFDPVPSVLLRNLGDGRFEDISAPSGIGAKPSTGLGVACDDFDEDGWPDLFVANDGYANHLWINQHDTTFQEQAIPLGVAYNSAGDAEAGMGIAAADFDGDGLTDALLTHLHQETNTLYRNLGLGRGFQDTTAASGLGAPSLPFTGFGIVALDIELDGDLDVAIANGRVRSHSAALPGALVPAPWDRLAEPSQVFLGQGDGAFALLPTEACGLCDPVELGRGLVTGDLDGDGDLDLVKSSIEGPVRVYRNDAPRAGGWLRVRAIDPALRRDAIGARLVLHVGERALARTIAGGGSYASASELAAHFGLGTSSGVGPLEVRWPGGDRESFAVPCVDCAIVVRRGEGEAVP